MLWLSASALSLVGAAVSNAARDVLSPREVAERAGFSYHAILRAIRRGDLQAFEPVPGQYRIELHEYERWLHTPLRPRATPRLRATPTQRARTRSRPTDPASYARLTAIEANR